MDRSRQTEKITIERPWGAAVGAVLLLLVLLAAFGR